jgi:hypothetical protein
MPLPENWRDWPSGTKQRLLDRLELLAARVMADKSRLREMRIIDWEGLRPKRSGRTAQDCRGRAGFARAYPHYSGMSIQDC